MKTTPYEWRKGTVAGFNAQIESLQQQRDQIQSSLDELIKLRDALKDVELKRPWTKKADTGAPVKKSSVVHWSKRPGVDPKKLAAWKKKMAKNARKATKAKQGANR